jgi:hypothetical protein
MPFVPFDEGLRSRDAGAARLASRRSGSFHLFFPRLAQLVRLSGLDPQGAGRRSGPAPRTGGRPRSPRSQGWVFAWPSPKGRQDTPQSPRPAGTSGGVRMPERAPAQNSPYCTGSVGGFKVDARASLDGSRVSHDRYLMVAGGLSTHRTARRLFRLRNTPIMPGFSGRQFSGGSYTTGALRLAQGS